MTNLELFGGRSLKRRRACPGRAGACQATTRALSKRYHARLQRCSLIPSSAAGTRQRGFYPMPRVFHPLLRILANATHRKLATQVQYLKVENEILRSKLPKRVTVTPAGWGSNLAAVLAPHARDVAAGESSRSIEGSEHPSRDNHSAFRSDQMGVRWFRVRPVLRWT